MSGRLALAALAAFLSAPVVFAAVLGGIAGLFIGFATGNGARFADRSGWGGGGWAVRCWLAGWC